jgi:Inosine-uridine preferring nucleoside hydrolase
MTLRRLSEMLPTALAATAEAENHSARRPALLSTDCGCEMDDQWALALLALSPALDLRAVVGAHGPTLPAPAAADFAREVLRRMNRAEPPPVVAGAGGPLADAATPVESEGTTLLLREARDFSPPRRLAVLAIGPATDVASALLLDPGLADRIEVVAVGFDRWPGGGALSDGSARCLACLGPDRGRAPAGADADGDPSPPPPARRHDLRARGAGAGEIQWITALEERLLWAQFVQAVQSAGRERSGSELPPAG